MTAPVDLPHTVFKAYDIRGRVPDQLDEPFAQRLGLALGQRAQDARIRTVVVGYDGRLSSPGLARALMQGLALMGVDVVNIGLVPTPLVYFAAHELDTGSGIMVTGSHNPAEYNGFKIMLGGSTLYGPDIETLRSQMQTIQAPEGIAAGHITARDMVDTYIARIAGDLHLARPLNIAIDCGNGAGGVVAQRLFAALGCQVDALYCEVDGRFPNHHPDPAEPANLQALIHHVQNSDCELGLAFDGDADRLGVVTRSGQIIWPDRQLILYARDVLQRHPGATIVFDVKCSRHVARAIQDAGGQALMGRTGHSLIKAEMARTGALLAGEMSGHIFFGERWYGFDDGLYTGARLLEILARHDNPSAVLEALPQDVSTPELKLPLPEGQAHALITRLQQDGHFPGATQLITLDGVRAEYPDGFGLARASNTTPVVVLRFEGETADALARIQQEFRQALLPLLPATARLPF